MTPRLEDVPTTGAPPVDATPSAVVARLRSYRPSRRAVLRGLLVGAAAAALVPVDWYLTRREASAQPADDRSEHTTCSPAEYSEEANNWWTGGPAVCYGGWRRGSFPCADGFHREGSYSGRGEKYVSNRLTTNCGGRNAWRWKGYRCSDAMTTATFEDGSEYSALTIAACTLSGGGGAVDPGTRGSGDGGTGDGGTGNGGTGNRGTGDPSQPLRVLPDLGALLGR